MSQSLECPRCCRQTAEEGRRNGHGQGRCPVCGMELIAAAGPKEAEVRKYLYGHRVLPLAPASDRDKREP